MGKILYDAPGSGEGHASVWIDASIPLHFIYFGSRMPAINRDWLEALRNSSNSDAGLHALAEDAGSEPLTATETLWPGHVPERLPR